MNRFFYAMMTAFFLFSICSCEGFRCADGTVVEKQTGLRLDSVECIVISGGPGTLTDTAGSFSVCNYMGGCVPRCKDIEVKFVKKGYKSTQLVNPIPGSVIYLEKE
jgi:hypothetical protein